MVICMTLREIRIWHEVILSFKKNIIVGRRVVSGEAGPRYTDFTV